MRPERRRRDGGFTLIEVLVALAVVAVALTAIGSLIAASVRGTRGLEQHLALVATARAIEAGLPGRTELKVGSFTGEVGGHRWRVDVAPFAAFTADVRQPTAWIPRAVVIRVQSPGGSFLQVNTVRLALGP